ncbi:MAG: retroviral-like aspartic protease family protein [Muribaculaceae bacterium]|nr:retroviral-like aspartic protease family protein [Muribaculaceae bacterium]
MKIRNLLIAMAMAAGTATLCAKEIKLPDTYAFTRGMECLNEGKTEDALDWFQKEISEHPDNGYAYLCISTIHVSNNQNGSALSAINSAIKKIPSKDKDWASAALGVRADINLAMQDTLQALNDLARAMKIQPDNSSLWKTRAQIYYEQEKYDLSDADYREMTKIDAGDTMGYMGIGRNANAQERWDDAIAQFDHVIRLSPDYSQGYSFRADAYIGQKKWAEATDDIVRALDIDGDDKAFYLMQTLPAEASNMMKTKLKIQMAKEPANSYWPYCAAIVAKNYNDYDEAISYYEQANNIDANSVFPEGIARCLVEKRDFARALDYADRALAMSPEDYDVVELKSRILSDMRRFDECIAEHDKIVARYPDSVLPYLNRAEDLMLAQRYDKALEDYSTALVMAPRLAEVTTFLVKKGDAARLCGKVKDAESDYRQILELEKDSTLNSNCWTAFAYSGLGEADKAIEAARYIVDNDTSEMSGNLYNLACIYARLQMKEKAMETLLEAVDAGYNNFVHAGKDYDLDLLHEMPEFQALINSHAADAAPDETHPVQEENIVYETVEIPFTKESGITKVKCSINDLPLHFVFDTGASDVTMSMVEANFMLKNDYIKPSDIIGSVRYMDANGDISEGTVINLRKVNFGGLELDNVRASVVRNQVAPLLLGQSVLGRLGKIEIDNPGLKLVITHKVNK